MRLDNCITKAFDNYFHFSTYFQNLQFFQTAMGIKLLIIALSNKLPKINKYKLGPIVVVVCKIIHCVTVY